MIIGQLKDTTPKVTEKNLLVTVLTVGSSNIQRIAICL